MEPMKDEDPRVRTRVVTSDATGYRAVAPAGKGYYLNGGLVIEKAVRDSLGVVAWVKVGTVERPLAASTENDPMNEALYWLLGGQGAR